MTVQVGALILGSGSPRRREILESMGLSVEVCPAQLDESPLASELALTYVERIAREKLHAVKEQHPRRRGVLLVADTTVTQQGRILGKPRDDDEALAMLRGLTGGRHQVLTCYALQRLGDANAEVLQRTISTEVIMRAASDAELRSYVATGECEDKAGAYAIQGKGAFLVESIIGSYSGVVGLPVCELVMDLRRLGVLQEYP